MIELVTSIASAILCGLVALGTIPASFFCCSACLPHKHSGLRQQLYNLLRKEPLNIGDEELVSGVKVETDERDYAGLELDDNGQICKNGKVHYSNYYGVGKKLPAHRSLPTGADGQLLKAFRNPPSYRVMLKERAPRS